MLESLRLQNFTCFSDLQLEFVPGVNVFVGENGTGKTHILKVIYTLLDAKNVDGDFVLRLGANFRTFGRSIGRLIRTGREDAKIIAVWDGIELSCTIHTPNNLTTYCDARWSPNISAVYIPAKEILSNAPGFLSLYSKRYISYEAYYPQMLENAYLNALRELPAEIVELADEIEKVIGGEVEVRGEEFFINDIEMPLIAEGHRKLALIWLLLQNGLLGKDTVLVWDEPEANLNPLLISLVAKTLLKLAELGAQIFLATHSYVFLKELDLQAKTTEQLGFFALKKSETGVTATPAETYLGIEPNPISDAYTQVYHKGLEKTLGGVK
ncbi:MAG: AAA family ATPase [Armatimonadetes bacterium]|nr:AAA family ATPase [Armatimonadota bacterium]